MIVVEGNVPAFTIDDDDDEDKEVKEVKEEDIMFLCCVLL